MTEHAHSPDDATPLDALVRSYRAGDDDGSELCRRLESAARNALLTFPGLDDATRDDAVQDALFAVLQYLRRDREFEGDVARLCVSIARNRCRDVSRRRTRRPETPIESMAEWIADTTASALDVIDDEERLSLLQRGLDALSDACRRLLLRIYITGVAIETIRAEEGLGSVQAVYYRRDACLDQARKHLNRLRPRALRAMENATRDAAPPRQGRTPDES